MKRRELLTGAGALLAFSSLTGCRKRERAAVLRALVGEVVVDMARDVWRDTRVLHKTVQALAAAPGVKQQQAAERAFKSAALSWKRAEAFQSGVFASTQVFQRAAFWPAKPAAIEAVLAEAGPIDEQRVEGSGVDARGLYALEYVLFAPARATDLTSRTASGARGRAYARELSVNLLGYAARLWRALGDAQTFAASFASGGRASVSELIAHGIDTLEVVRGKLARVARGLKEPSALPSSVEGHFSHCSVALAQALVQGTQRLYVGGGGGGLSDLVAEASPDIDEHVRVAFATVDASFDALPAALDVALDTQPAAFNAARSAVEALQHVLRVEAVSALEA